jgi:hypothetical protein
MEITLIFTIPLGVRTGFGNTFSIFNVFFTTTCDLVNQIFANLPKGENSQKNLLTIKNMGERKGV